MKALVFSRKPARYAAAVVAGRLAPGGGAGVGPLRLTETSEPDLPGDDWVRLRPRLAGICGSDLATIDGRSSRYFEPIVSFPFVPGHEVVAEAPDGRRVVIEPVLGCVARGINPPCGACASGDLGNCERIAFGDLSPGPQSGFCCDTGGGWSGAMVAHPSQLHNVPDEFSDEAAVMVEPVACAVHAVAATPIEAGSVVAVIGAGTLGLATVAALAQFTEAGTIIAVAKHPVQRQLASDLGAHMVVAPGEIRRAVRRATGTMAIGDGSITRLAGGAPVVMDCVGSAASIGDALDVVRPRGQITLVGMPGVTELDLTGLWQREVRLAGAYAYGTENTPTGRRRTFDMAFELVGRAGLERLVSATYPLSRYREAIAHAAAAGSRGAVKIAFDLRHNKERTR